MYGIKVSIASASRPSENQLPSLTFGFNFRLRRRREQLYPWSSFHHQKIPPILWKFKKQFSSSFCKYVNHNAGLLIKVHCSFAHRSVCDAFVVIHSYFKVNCSYTRYLSIAQLFNVFESGHIT